MSKNRASAYTAFVVFFCSIVCISFFAKAFPAPGHPPAFTGGTEQALSICENSSPTTINSELAVIDSDAGLTETWTVSSGPVHGSLTGFPVSASSTGGVVTPSWLDYTPATGYSGADSFSIQVSNGSFTAVTTIAVTINPLPELSSTLTPPPVCDGSVFNYAPASGAAGATFSWHRVFVPGISNSTASGTDNPGETLENVTNGAVTTTYIFTVSADGCSSTSDVLLTVYPAPRLSGSLADTICSGSLFSYLPSSPTPGITYAWSRAVITGITPVTPSSGTDTISETLNNTTAGPLTVTYSFELTANGCNSSRNLNVTVYPQPGAATITTASPSTVCSGTQFQNFGASSLPASGSTYTWSAQNATIQATGNTSQYCLVNFPDAGNASVTLTVGSGTPCAGVSTYSVAVGNDISATYSVIYYNYNFVFQDNSQDSYQWGYDNVNTLDSTLLPGATFQSYENTNPDFGSNYYWVITVKNGCMQKTYFNGPLATTTPISSAHSRMLKIKPNPAGNQIIISAGPAGSNNGKVIITDIAGQIHLIQNLTGNDTPIDISMLPQGYYLVSHFVNELKISTSRFVKNQE